MINIVRLPSVRLLAGKCWIAVGRIRHCMTCSAAMLLTRTFSFAGAENLAQRKLVQKGMKKEQVASLMVFITPVSIILPGILSKYITERPLTLFKKVSSREAGLSHDLSCIGARAPLSSRLFGQLPRFLCS